METQKKPTQIKVGLLNPNTKYTRINGTDWLMLSDSDGSTKSKHIKSGMIDYPKFGEVVLADLDPEPYVDLLAIVMPRNNGTKEQLAAMQVTLDNMEKEREGRK